MSGPKPDALATAAATAPVLPSPADVAQTWACLAACWVACQLQQQQHGTAVAAAAAALPAGTAVADAAVPDAECVSAALQQLGGRLATASEAESAKVQLVASKALALVCDKVHAAAQQLQQQQARMAGTAGMSGQGQQEHEQGQATELPDSCHDLQQHLAALQAVLVEYQQAGLSYILDFTSSVASDDVPEAPVTLDELLEQHDAEEQLGAALHQQQSQPAQQQWAADAAAALQLVQQLLLAVEYEAMPPLVPWAAAAAMDGSGSVSPAGDGTPAAAPAACTAVVMQAGPVSQVQLWHAAATLVHDCWQRLQQQTQQAVQLELQVQALAAVAGAGGAAGIASTNTALLAQAEQLQRQLLPQGYDITYADDCVAAAQLLQLQWSELERGFVANAAACLCPMLGLTRLGLEHWQNSCNGGDADVDEQGLLVLQRLLAAATASVSQGAMMHSKDVFDVLAGSSASTAGLTGSFGEGSGSSSDTGAMWGTPELSAAWRSLIVLLLQCGCLQQHILQQQQQQHSGAAAAPAAAEANGSRSSSLDVLGSIGSALPLDFDQYRPLVFVLQVLHQLLHPEAPEAAAVTGEHGSVIAAPGPHVFNKLHRLLLPAVHSTLLLPLQQHVGRLQQHLQLLSSEAASVLHRHQHGYNSSSRTTQLGSDAAAAGHSGSDAGAGLAVDAASSSQVPGGLQGPVEPQGLVPFDAFDPSLPGAGMILEGDGLGGLEDEEGDWAAAEQLGQETDDQDGEDIDWLLEEEAAQQDAAAAGRQQELQQEAAGLSELVPFTDFDPAQPGVGALLEDGGAGESLQGELEDAGVELPGAGSVAVTAAGGSLHAVTDAAIAAEWQVLGQQLLSIGLQRAEQLSRQQLLVGLQQAGPSCEWQLQVWLRHLAAFEWLWSDLLELQQQQQGDATKQLLAQLVEATAAVLGIPVDSSGDGQAGGAAGTGDEAAPTAATVAAAAAGALKPGDAYQWYFTQLGLLPLLPHHPDHSGSGSSADLDLASLAVSPQGGLAAGFAAADAAGVLHMPSRAELLPAWQEVAESLSGLEASLTAWQEAGAAAAGAVRIAVEQKAAEQQVVGDPSVCFKVGMVGKGVHTRVSEWCFSWMACNGLAMNVV